MQHFNVTDAMIAEAIGILAEQLWLLLKLELVFVL